MSHRKIAAIIAALLAVTGAALLLLGRSREPARSRGTPTPNAETLAPDDPRFAAIERELSRLRGELNAERLKNAAKEAEKPTSQGSEAREPEPPPSPEEAAVRERERSEFIAATQKAEPRDEAWARPLEGKLRELFRAPALADATLIGVDCRSSLCSIEANVRDQEQWQSLTSTLAESVSAELPRLTFHREDDGRGGLRVTTFGARPGTRLPAYRN